METMRAAPLYMFRRYFLLFSVSSYPRAWLMVYSSWRPERMVMSLGQVVAFVVCPQFLLAWTMIKERVETPKGTAFVVEEPLAFGDFVFGEELFEAVAVASALILGCGNIISGLRQLRLGQWRRVLRENFRSLMALEFLDVLRLWMCTWIIIWFSRVPFLGKLTLRLIYRAFLLTKTAQTISTTLPFHIVAMCQPVGWRRIFRSPVDVLNEELDDIEASWLPVVAALGRHASRRRAARRIVEAHQQHLSGGGAPVAVQFVANPPMVQQPSEGATQDQIRQLQQHQAFLQEAFAMRALLGSAPRVQFGARERQVTWPPKLPLAPEPPLSDDELDALSRDAPHHLVCPISLRLPLEPAISVSGTTYDRHDIVRAVAQDGRDPLTYERCRVTDIRPNYAVRQILHDFIVKYRREKAAADDVPSSDTDNVVVVTEKASLTVRDLVRRLNTMTPADVYAANHGRRLGFDDPVPNQITVPLDPTPPDDDDTDDAPPPRKRKAAPATRISPKRYCTRQKAGPKTRSSSRKRKTS